MSFIGVWNLVTNNNFNVLKWDRESAIYIPITIELK